MRDAVPPPPEIGKWGPRRRLGTENGVVSAPRLGKAANAPEEQTFTLTRSLGERRAVGAKEASERERLAESRGLLSWTKEVAAAPRQPQPAAAADRLEALRRRVRARERQAAGES